MRKSELSAALLAVRRIRQLLQSDSTPPGDIIKAAAMLLDRVRDEPDAMQDEFTLALSE